MDREGAATTARRTAVGVGALLVLVGVVAGVPFALWRTVGNPWPGWERVELGDQLLLVTGLLAVVAWLVWARFAVAVIGEVRVQVRMVAADERRAPDAPVDVAVPPDSRVGVGLLAQRLVAAVLVLLPLALRASPAIADMPLRAVVGHSAFVVADAPPTSASAHLSNAHDVATGQPPPMAGAIVVEPGDTLIGLARTHLGDGARWREIFELNRDRPQPGGGHLATPGVVLAGWTLELPAGPAVGPIETDVTSPTVYAATERVTVEQGDTLWDLAHDRLERAGAAHDDSHVVVYLDDVVAANAAVAVDPDLLAVGQDLDLPSIDTPSAPSAESVPPVSDVTVVPVAPKRPTVAPVDDAVSAPSGVDVTVAQAVSGTALGGVGTTPAAPAAAATTSTDGAGTSEPTVRGVGAEQEDGSPSPIGLGEAALLSSGVLALLVARRRMRLRASLPGARVPEPAPEQIATERALRTVGPHERVLRVDVAIRAAAAGLLDTRSQIAVACVAADGTIELTLTCAATLPEPWSEQRGRWVLPGAVPIERLAEAARSVGAPCVGLVQLGVDDDARDVFVDLEALGLLGVAAEPARADAVVRAIAATLGTSVFSEVANLIGVGLDAASFLVHRSSHHVDDLDEAIDLATTLLGSTATARASTFDLRARHTSGEAWEPAIVLGASSVAQLVPSDLVRGAARRRGGLAVVLAGDVEGAPWTLRATADAWELEPIGMRITPVELSIGDLRRVDELLRTADEPLHDELSDAAIAVPDMATAHADATPSGVPHGDSDDASGVDHVGVERVDENGDGPAERGDGAASRPAKTVEGESLAKVVALSSASALADRREDASGGEPPWHVLVRLLGPVEVVDRSAEPVRFEKSKSLELVAWVALHRERPTRAGARTALWDLDVRDSTFANVVSQARRAMARHVAPPDGEEWLGRTNTERLPLHPLVVTDADLVRSRLDHARRQPPPLAVETLRPAVALIRDLPFSGTGYLWPDPEGIASNLVLLATGAATELAGHYLSLGDVDGVFWATGQGLRVLPAHEELIALRMRAHACSGDLSGVRLEWECYERVLDADPWGAGEPAQKLVLLRRQLLAS